MYILGVVVNEYEHTEGDVAEVGSMEWNGIISPFCSVRYVNEIKLEFC